MVDAWAAEHLEIQTRDARAGGRPGPQRRRVFVGPYAPVSLGDYLRRLQPRAAHRRGCACHSSGLSVQSFLRGSPRRRVRPRGAGRGRAARDRRSASAEDLPGSRRRGAGALRRVRRERSRLTSRCATTCAGVDAVRRAAARRAGPAQHQREPVPAARRRLVAEHRARPSPRRPATSTATPTGTRRAARATSRPTSAARPASPARRAGLGGQRLQRGACSSCCRPSAARAARRSASSRRTRCTRDRARHRAPAGSPGRRARRTSRFDLGRGRRRGRASTGPTSCSCRSPNNPTGTALPLEIVDALCAARRRRHGRRRRGVRRVRARGHAVARSTLLAEHPQPGRHPHDVQGVRAGRCAAWATCAAAPEIVRRAAAGPAALPPVRASPRRSRAPRCAHADELLGTGRAV